MQTVNPSDSYGEILLNNLRMMGKFIFNMEEAKAAAEFAKIPHEQLNKILSNLVKQKKALRLRRGIYVAMGLLRSHETLHPFVISAFLIQPSAISHWSALHYHGMTEQIPRIITASTAKKVITPSMRTSSPHSRKEHVLKVEGNSYEYFTIHEKHFFGYKDTWFHEYLHVLIMDKERTLLDVFIYSKMFGGMGGAFDILKKALSQSQSESQKINIELLVLYTVQYGKPTIAKRLGWALEYFGVSEEVLTPLLEIPLNYYCRLDPHAPTKGHCDKRWMIQNNLVKDNK